MIRTTPRALGRQLRSRNKATLGAIARGALRGAHRGRAIVVRETPVDQAQLKAAWKVKPGNPALLKGEISLLARLFGTLLAELRNDAPHGGIVELGARPHPVSPEGIQAIADWVLRNLAIGVAAGPVQRGTGGRRAFNKRTREAIALDIAQAIAWKIRHHGQEPTYFVRGCMALLHGVVQDEVEKAIAAVARRGGPRGGPRGGASSAMEGAV